MKKKDKYDIIIDDVDLAYEKMQEYAGIVNGYQDGIADDRLEEDEAEMLADSWYKTLEELSNKTNIHLDTLIDMFNILDHASKRDMLKQAEALDTGYKLRLGVR